MDLKEARFHRRTSQWDISVKTGIPQSKLSLIENGYVVPKDEEKEKIATALNCSVEEIFPAEIGSNRNATSC